MLRAFNKAETGIKCSDISMSEEKGKSFFFMSFFFDPFHQFFCQTPIAILRMSHHRPQLKSIHLTAPDQKPYLRYRDIGHSLPSVKECIADKGIVPPPACIERFKIQAEGFLRQIVKGMTQRRVVFIMRIKR